MVLGFPDYIEVLVISLLLSVASVLISKFTTNQSAIRNLKMEMKSLNEKIKKSRNSGDNKEMNRLSSELMKLSSRQMQMNMRPMMVSVLLFMGVFWFFGMAYSGLVVPSPVNIPFVGNQLGWFHWYFLIILPGSFMFRKLLGVE